MASGRRNLASLLEDLARDPRRPAFALRTPYRRFTWSAGEVHAAAMGLAERLGSIGVLRGDRVLLQGPNSPQWCAAFLGIVARGAIAVPLDAGASAEFSRRVAERVEPRAAVASEGLSAALRPLPGIAAVETLESLASRTAAAPRLEPHQASPGDTAEIVFTSGTTAEPRGVELSHANLLASLERIEAGFLDRQWYLRPLLPFKLMCVVPLSHLFGQSLGLCLPILLRSTGLFVESLQASRLLQAIRADHPIAVVTVPRTLAALREALVREVQRRGRLPALERALERATPASLWRRILAGRPARSVLGWRTWVVVVGGAPLEAELESFWVRCGLVVIQGYGMTEAAPIVSVHNPLRGGRHTLGRPVGGIEVRLAEDGEVLVRGANVMKGYWGDPEATRQALSEGWLRTGDLASRDQEGRLYYRGRKKDVLVTAGGMNVFPSDVESVLAALPGVREAVVFGLPGPTGEEVHAAVLASGPAPDPERLREAANARLESHQRLRRVILWEGQDLPRTPTGKVRRGEVAAIVSRGAGASEETRSPSSAVDRVLGRIRADRAAGRDPRSAFSDPLDLDSLETIELLGRLEEEYGVAVDERVTAPPRTLGDLEGLLSAGAAAPPSRIEMPRWSRRAAARAARRLIQPLLISPLLRIFVRLRVEGRGPAGAERGPCILVANHTSALDVPAILLALPRHLRRKLCPAMAIETLPEHFDPEGRAWWRRLRSGVLYGLAVLAFDAYPLPQTRGFRPSLEYTGELLDAGLCPLVFPEGRMTRTGEMGSFKAGIGLLALVTRSRILPVRVEGLGRILPPEGRWPRRGAARVVLGTSFDPLEGVPADPAAVAARIEKSVRDLGPVSPRRAP